MRRLALSPATVVALAALFVALSGTTYAVTQIPSRSIDSRQLKKGAVRTENIANGAVTASKLSRGLSARIARTTAQLRADTTYADKAGYADNAGHADKAALADRATTAGAADTATTAGSAITTVTAGDAAKLGGHDASYYLPRSVIVPVPRFTLGSDQQQDILQHGPFTITARCYINKPNGDDADVQISTTEAHSAFEGFTSNPDLNPGDPESVRSLIGVDGPTGTPLFESSAAGSAVAPSGSEIRSIILYVGVNLFGQPGSCTFGGFFIL
jgi:hypothetical protein